MNKILFFTIITLITLNITAQEEGGLKGTWWAAGTVGFYNNKSSDGMNENKSTNIMPVIGNFVTDNTTIGLGVGYNHYEYSYNNNKYSDEDYITVMPLARKYWNLKGNLYFFGQAGLPVQFGKDKIDDTKYTSVGVSVAPGLDYIVNDWLTIETTFNLFYFNVETAKPSSGDSVTNTYFDFATQDYLDNMSIGVKFLF